MLMVDERMAGAEVVSSMHKWLAYVKGERGGAPVVNCDREDSLCQVCDILHKAEYDIGPQSKTLSFERIPDISSKRKLIWEWLRRVKQLISMLKEGVGGNSQVLSLIWIDWI
jgi:hypothetical protein